MNQHEINEAEWSDRANWRWGVYNSPRDTRVWVAKPIKWMGLTLNFAHQAAYVWLLCLLSPALIVVAVSFPAASR